MRANTLLKIAVPVLFVAIVLGVFLFTKDDVVPLEPGSGTVPVVTIGKTDAKLLGVEGDTANDTLATLVGQMNDMKKNVATLSQQNEVLAKENARLRDREANTDSKIEQRLKKVLSDVSVATVNEVNKIEPSIAAVQEKVNAVANVVNAPNAPNAPNSSNTSTSEDLPVGLGLQQGDGQSFGDVFNFKFDGGKNRGKNTAKNTVPRETEALIWIEPLDSIPVDPKTKKPVVASATFPGEFKKAALTPVDTFNKINDRYKDTVGIEKRNGQGRNETTKPVYTIAENATLLNATTMTALIGRIPRSGTVTDPFPFKVLIGRDNLMANGIELPEVAGAVVSGDVTGDWMLSCARAQVNSITFIFEDGTIRTVPEPVAKIGRGSTNKANAGIGYLSDPYGIPCISGERRHNAAEFLGTTTIMTAIGAAIADQLGGENITYDGNGVMTQQETNKAFDSILTSGFNNANAWVNRLYGEAFEAIYVPPAQRVAIHITNEITIDYEPHGRKVNNDANTHTVADID